MGLPCKDSSYLLFTVMRINQIVFYFALLTLFFVHRKDRFHEHKTRTINNPKAVLWNPIPLFLTLAKFTLKV